VAPPGTKGPRHLCTISSSSSPPSLDLLSLLKPLRRATPLRCPPRHPSSSPCLAGFASSLRGPPRSGPLPRPACGHNAVIPGNKRMCHANLWHPASSLAWLTPTQHLHPCPAWPATCLHVRRPTRSPPLAWPVRLHRLVVRDALPSYGTCTHRPHHRCPRPVPARDRPHPAVSFAGHTAPPLAIGVSPLHLYVCVCTSVECVCAMFCVCDVCVVCTHP
jgi:hypothetical protein